MDDRVKPPRTGAWIFDSVKWFYTATPEKYIAIWGMFPIPYQLLKNEDR